MPEFKPAVVVNMNAVGTDYDVYMGRPGRGFDGPFGNPFGQKMHRIRSDERSEVRQEIIGQHRVWFMNRVGSDLVFLAKVLALRGKRLGCFCKPKPCHADVIAEFVNHVEEAAVPKPVGAPWWDGCSVCSGLMWTQITNRHRACPDCGRWFCPTHFPKEVHACPGR